MTRNHEPDVRGHMADDGVQQQLSDHDRRLRDIEGTKPDVLANRVDNLTEDVREMRSELRDAKRAWNTLAIAIVGGSLMALLAVERFFTS